jgi:hypothetical protein
MISAINQIIFKMFEFTRQRAHLMRDFLALPEHQLQHRPRRPKWMPRVMENMASFKTHDELNEYHLQVKPF